MNKLKSHKTVEQIAKKHRLEVSFVKNQLKMGIPIEHEHTKDKDLATDIALQHLDEIPDYYTRLKKMESSAKKSHKKYKDVTEGKKMKGEDPCWKGYQMVGKKKKNGKEVPNCVPVKEENGMMRYCPKCQKDETRSECKYGPKFWDMYSLPKTLGKDYHANSPHPGNFPESYDHEHSMARSELSTIASAVKRLKKKMKGEGNIEAWVQSKITKAADYLDTAADYVDSGEMKEQVANTGTMSDKKPFDIAVKKIMDRRDKMTSTQRISALKQAGKLQGVDEQMLPPIDPEVHKRLQKTQKLYNKGTSTDNPNEKEIFLKRTGPQLPLAKAKSTTQVAHYEPENDLVEYSNWRVEFGLSEDWQKVNRKDKTDGLSQKAVNAYRKENPGSKLQTAVTEKNPTGKRAKRRASFCRRMKGAKEKLTSEKTARDPDSRINKALRRWNCN